MKNFVVSKLLAFMRIRKVYKEQSGQAKGKKNSQAQKTTV